MYGLLVLAALVTLTVAQIEIEKEADGENTPEIGNQDEESRINYLEDRRDHRMRDRHDDRKHDRHEDHEHEYQGPVIYRTIPSHNTRVPDIARQDKIIQDVYSPDYYQPIRVLDYRYLKTGGRDYTRGPGGQYLILPKGIRTDEHKEFSDFDSLLEHLRLKALAENQERHRHEQSEKHRPYKQYN